MGKHHDTVSTRMREAFLKQLRAGAQVVFAALPQDEQDRLIGITGDNRECDIRKAELCGIDYDCGVTEQQVRDASKSEQIVERLVKESQDPDFFAKLGKEVREREDKRRAALSPGEREAEDARRAEYEEYQEYLATATVPLYELYEVQDNLETLIDQLTCERDALLGKTIDQEIDLSTQGDVLKQQQKDLEAARDRINTLLERNLKLQDIHATLASIQATTQRTEQGVGALVQHLPDAKKPTAIPWEEAVAIMEAKGGNMTERTGRNWIKAGKAAKTGTPISWDDLRTTQSWAAWVDAYLAALRSRATCRKIVSERAAQVEQESRRRRSPNA